MEKENEKQMKIVGRVLGFSLALGLVICGVVMMGAIDEALIGAVEEEEPMPAGSCLADRAGGMFTLIRPVFAYEMQAAGLTFLEEEAGISVFTDVGREIDLVRAQTAFRTIERQTDEYIVGSVALPGRGEEWDVHVFVHRNGWIIAYYHRDRATGKIIDWDGPGHTNLETALAEVATAAGVPFVRVDFYDFRFPGAERLLVITDDDSFRIKIPLEIFVHDRAFSLRSDCAGHTRLIIGGDVIGSIRRGETLIGTISPGILPVGTYHTIERGGAAGRVAIIITYSAV